MTILCGCCIKMHIDTTPKQHTDNLLSVNDTVKFMFIVQIAMYYYDMYVKVAYDNFNNKRRYDDDDDDDEVRCADVPWEVWFLEGCHSLS